MNHISSAHLYLHPLVQWSVHECVERQEKCANGVEESIPILAVPIEPESEGHAWHHKYSSLKYESEKHILVC